MAEIISMANVLFAAYTCDKCGSMMEFDEKAFDNSSELFPHICKNCGNKIMLKIHYPCIKRIFHQEKFRLPTKEEENM